MASAAGRNQVKGEGVVQEVEDVRVRAKPFGACAGDGRFNHRAIVRRGPGRRDVGAVNREMDDVGFQRGTQPLGRIVARGVVAGSDARENAREHGEFARQDVDEHAAFGAGQNLFKFPVSPDASRQARSSVSSPRQSSKKWEMTFSHSYPVVPAMPAKRGSCSPSARIFSTTR